MNITAYHLDQLQSNMFNPDFTSVTIQNLLTERNYCHIEPQSLFMAHFKAIPNVIEEERIDCKKANKWFLNHFEKEVKDVYYIKRSVKNSKDAVYDDIYYFLHEDAENIMADREKEWLLSCFCFA